MPNLQVLKPSRRPPRRGDIFALSPRPGTVLFGRVIATDARVGSMKAILVYIYDVRQAEVGPPAEKLVRLLLPPILVNRLPWSRGYFQTVATAEIPSGELLPVHAFRDSRGRLFDEHSNPISGTLGPVGQHGLHSFRSLDDAVSDALGFVRASE
jgi:hypothetical protein